MEAARVSSLRGHRVTLWEKGNALGGNLIPASVPDFKQDYQSLIGYLSSQIKKLGVGIELGKEATPKLIQEAKPDVLFIASGGKPITPQIPGIEGDKVVTAVDLLLGRKEAKGKVVIIGGGLVGCEVALYLARKGKAVTIIEILDRIMSDIFLSNRMHLEKLLSDAKVTVLTESSVLEITDQGVNLCDKSGNKNTITAETVAIAAGYKPETRLLDAVTNMVPEVYGIGDCVEPGKVIGAIWKAYRTARLI